MLLFSGRQGLDRAAAPGREGVPPRALPVPAAARRHRPQLPRGDRVPRPPRRRARRAAARRLGAGVDRRRARGRGARAARLAQPPADDDAARRDRGAPLRRLLRRRAPRRGARAGEGARDLAARRLRRLGPAAPAPRAVGPLQHARRRRASTCACSRCRTGPSSTSGSTSARRQLEVPSIYLAHERDGVRARRDAARGVLVRRARRGRGRSSRRGCATARSAT